MIRQSVTTLATTAVVILLKQINCEAEAPQQVIFPTEMVVRHTTGAPRL